MTAMARFPDPHPHLDGLINTFDLAREPVDLYLRRLNGGLDHEGLEFGTRYRVVQDLRANRSGEAVRGTRLWFLGQYIFPHDNGLRLFFEGRDGAKVVFEFEGNLPQTDTHERMIDRRNVDHYFAPVRFDFSRRTKRLAAARAVIEFHRKGA